jgi:hypothetical protein
MLTIFSCPKAFEGKTAVNQYNAVKSWLLLDPKPEIILIGDDNGVEGVCRDLDLCHIPDVERNEYGTPLVNSIFNHAASQAAHNTLCYINTDIILTSGFIKAVQCVKEQHDKYLMIGRRHDLSVDDYLDFNNAWQSLLKRKALREGKLHASAGMDYFVFSRGVFSNVLPFAVGRTAWDGWLVHYARCQGVSVINATASVWAIHQNHQYPPYLCDEKGNWKGEEVKRNLQLSGGLFQDITNATHKLKRNRIQRRSLYLIIEPFILFMKGMKQKLLKLRRRF